MKQWQIDKTLLVSLRWCRIQARKKHPQRGSCRVAQSIVKMIRSNTQSLTMDSIPHIDRTKQNKKKRVNISTETVEVDVDNLLLMSDAQEFVVQELEGRDKKCKFKRAPEHVRMMMKHVTDVYTFKYDKDEDYVDVGKLVYNRVVPMRLVTSELLA